MKSGHRKAAATTTTTTDRAVTQNYLGVKHSNELDWSTLLKENQIEESKENWPKLMGGTIIEGIIRDNKSTQGELTDSVSINEELSQEESSHL